ncbi:MAG: universal stress protein [Nitrososphaeraceae archaeon]
MTQKILVPHDGSELSDRALNKAIEFTKPLKSDIIILHILDDKLIPSEAIMSILGKKSSTVMDAKLQILNIVRIGAEQLLKDRTEKVRKSGINVRFIVGMGSPAEGVANVARNENVDLIIMGSKELEKENGNKLKALGSVTRRVSEISDCPVMIVKQ